MSLFTIEKIGSQDGNRSCILSDEESYSYFEVKCRIGEVAEQLLSMGDKEERVIIKEPNPVQQLLYFLSSWKAGFVSVIVSPEISNERYERLLKRINPSIIIDGFIHRYKNKDVNASNGFSDFFFGALSSGTTGEEKIIWRSYETWQRAFSYQSKIFNIHGGDRLLLNGSFQYTANLNSALHILFEGGTVVHTKHKNPREIMKLIDEKNIHAIFMVPSLYRMLITHNEKKAADVQSVISAGSKMDTQTLMKLRELFPKARIVEYYGASELGHVSYLSYEDFLKKEGSVGKAFPDVKIKIENREIWVESPYIADEFPSPYSAGDLGYLDEEGYLFLLGREGNIINKAGQKIMAEEIEKVLTQHPKVKETAVFGKEHKIKGEEIVAFLAVDENICAVELKREIKNFCKKHLEHVKIPKEIIFVHEIPRNENGKIDRKELKNYKRRE